MKLVKFQWFKPTNFIQIQQNFSKRAVNYLYFWLHASYSSLYFMDQLVAAYACGYFTITKWRGFSLSLHVKPPRTLNEQCKK
jgi:hypothetical protein